MHRADWTTRSRGCVATTRAGTGARDDQEDAGAAVSATTAPTSVRASVGPGLVRLERTASGSLTAAVDGEIDQRAATALVRTLELMDARRARVFLDLGWVSRIDMEAFCTIVRSDQATVRRCR